jgi:3-phosphoshikimate 1-carboxyvinyltransferase
MNLISSTSSALQGEITLPGDKSLSHRAALFAALAEGESRIDNFLASGVTQALLDALTSLGVNWTLQQDGVLMVQGRGLEGLHSPQAPLNCGNSATTIRLLAGALAAAGVSAVLDGSAGLRRRPMDRVVEPLRQMGVNIDSTQGCAPLILQASPRPLHAIQYTLPVASAQMKTCLLLAALAAGGPTTLIEPGPSRDHTERMLREMGVNIQSEKQFSAGKPQYLTHLEPPKPLALKPLALSLPGDFSSAAFLIVAALVTPGSEITIRKVGLNSARTGLLDALLAMGAQINISAQATNSSEPVGDLTVRSSTLHGVDISGEQVVRMIDEFPIFAVAAAFARGVSTVSDAAELRLKESDRISKLCEALRMLGVDIQEKPDGFTIQGGRPLHGGSLASYGDHRLAMSLAVAGLAATQPVSIQGAEIIHESFPEFIQSLQSLGACLAPELQTI